MEKCLITLVYEYAEENISIDANFIENEVYVATISNEKIVTCEDVKFYSDLFADDSYKMLKTSLAVNGFAKRCLIDFCEEYKEDICELESYDEVFDLICLNCYAKITNILQDKLVS